MGRVDLKIVLLGHQAVGKTSLMQRFVNDSFNEKLRYQSTIGAAFASKEIQIEDKNIVLGIWDTAGLERYQAMTKIYYRGAAAAIVCYDVTHPETFSKAKLWIRELRSIERNCAIYLCATKKDLLDNVEQMNPTLDFIEKFTTGIQSKFFLTSSKTGENVAKIFNAVAKDCFLNSIDVKNVGEFITLTDDNKRSHCLFSCPM